MASVSSLNIFTIIELIFLSSKSNIWTSSRMVSIGLDFFFYKQNIFLFICMFHNFLLKIEHLKKYNVTIDHSVHPIPLLPRICCSSCWLLFVVAAAVC